jgi:hypothetical protein
LKKRFVRILLEDPKSKPLWDLYNIRYIIGKFKEANKRTEKACKKQREQI